MKSEYTKYQSGITEACLHPRFDAPYFVPVHQEKVTERAILDRHITAINEQVDRVMGPAWQTPMMRSPKIEAMMQELREFTKPHNITFVTAKAPRPEATIADTPFGIDLPIHNVEIIEGKQYLTAQRGKHRRSSGSFNAHFSFRDTIRSITGEDTIDQDLKEVPPNNHNQQ